MVVFITISVQSRRNDLLLILIKLILQLLYFNTHLYSLFPDLRAKMVRAITISIVSIKPMNASYSGFTTILPLYVQTH